MIDDLLESAGADLARIKNTRSRRHFLISVKGSDAWMVITKKKPTAAQVRAFKGASGVAAVSVGLVKWDKEDGVYVFYPKKAGGLARKWAAAKKALAKQHSKLKKTEFRNAVLFEPEDAEEVERTPREAATYGLEYLGFDIKNAASLRKAIITLQETYNLPGEPGVVDDYLLEVLEGFQEQLPVYLDEKEEAEAREAKWQAAREEIRDTLDVDEIAEEYNDDPELLDRKADFDEICRGMIGRGISSGGKFTGDDVVAIALSQKAYGISVTGSFDMATQVLAHWTRTRRPRISETTAIPDDARRERVTGRLFVDGASSSDVQQGYFGDCYFVATLASVADRYPDIIEDKLIREVSPGKFRVTFHRWSRGRFVETPIDVDADLLVFGDGSPYGAGTGREGAPRELWAALVEKAYFEFSNKYGIYGGYEAYSDEEYGGRLPRRQACPPLPEIAGIEPPDESLSDVKYYDAIVQTHKKLEAAIEALTDLDDEDAIDAAFGKQADEVLGLDDRELAALRRKLKAARKKMERRVFVARQRKLRSSPDEGGESRLAFQVLLGAEADADDDFAERDIEPGTLFRRLKKRLRSGACVTAGSLSSTPPEGDPPLLPEPPDFFEARRPRSPSLLRAKDPAKAFKKGDDGALERYCEALDAFYTELDEYDYSASERREAWDYLDEIEETLERARKWSDWAALKAQDTEGRLFFDHQYVVLDAVEIGGLYFVKLLNPHGASELRGGGADDGVFLMPMEKFMRFYETVEYCTPD